MRIKDMKQAVKLFSKEWNLGSKESGNSREFCAWIYLFGILEETEKFVYYRENGKMLGFAGYSKLNSKKHLFRKKIYSSLKNILYKKIKNLKGLKRYENNYSYLPDNLKNYFDGEVSMLILDSSKRGQGIGKKMLLDVFKLAKKDNMKNIQILTDESCSYYIYENLGCKKIYETIVKNEEIGKLGNISKEKVFIYEKDLTGDL